MNSPLTTALPRGGKEASSATMNAGRAPFARAKRALRGGRPPLADQVGPVSGEFGDLSSPAPFCVWRQRLGGSDCGGPGVVFLHAFVWRLWFDQCLGLSAEQFDFCSAHPLDKWLLQPLVDGRLRFG